jgi:ribosomal protein S1
MNKAITLQQGLKLQSFLLSCRASSTLKSSITIGEPDLDSYYKDIIENLIRPPPRPNADALHQARQAKLDQFRRSDYSQDLRGHMVLASVTDIINKTRLLLEVAGKPAYILSTELDPDDIIQLTPAHKLGQPRQPDDIMVGDQVKVYVHKMQTPENEALVYSKAAMKHQRLAFVWRELSQLYKHNQPVRGRILNKMEGRRGWAVGIAGIVAHLPGIHISASGGASGGGQQQQQQQGGGGRNSNVLNKRTRYEIGQLYDFKIIEFTRNSGYIRLAEVDDVYISRISSKLREENIV